jgi:small subunit ribosomal protein S4
MKLGPRYKLARRLGRGLFEKTQTAKFALRETKGRATEVKHPLQLLEKQKARFMYGVSERQFSKYVSEAVAKRGVNSVEMLYASLERRLDNVVYRIGFAPTRQAARQMVSHGHITVNGTKVTIPSYRASIGDKIAIREGSKKSPMFASLDERLKERELQSWIKFDHDTKVAEIQGMPKMNQGETLFDLGAVIEFYSR